MYVQADLGSEAPSLAEANAMRKAPSPVLGAGLCSMIKTNRSDSGT